MIGGDVYHAAASRTSEVPGPLERSRAVMGTRQRTPTVVSWRRIKVVAIVLALAAPTMACDRRSSEASSSDFVRYSPTAELVPPLETPASIHLGTPSGPVVPSACDDGDLFYFADGGPNGSEWRAVTQMFREPERHSRVVFFSTKRFDDQQQYDDQLAEYDASFGEPCYYSEDRDPGMEPLPLDGLPEGALTARWSGLPWDSVSTVLGDREHLIMMAVVWQEDPDPVPTEAFVDTVDSAWSDFVAANS